MVNDCLIIWYLPKESILTIYRKVAKGTQTETLT